MRCGRRRGRERIGYGGCKRRSSALSTTLTSNTCQIIAATCPALPCPAPPLLARVLFLLYLSPSASSASTVPRLSAGNVGAPFCAANKSQTFVGLLSHDMTDMFMMHQVKNMKTLAEALEVFTSEEVVSFKWDKEINADTGRRVLARIE